MTVVRVPVRVPVIPGSNKRTYILWARTGFRDVLGMLTAQGYEEADNQDDFES